MGVCTTGGDQTLPDSYTPSHIQWVSAPLGGGDQALPDSYTPSHIQWVSAPLGGGTRLYLTVTLHHTSSGCLHHWGGGGQALPDSYTPSHIQWVSAPLGEDQALPDSYTPSHIQWVSASLGGGGTRLYLTVTLHHTSRRCLHHWGGGDQALPDSYTPSHIQWVSAPLGGGTRLYLTVTLHHTSSGCLHHWERTRLHLTVTLNKMFKPKPPQPGFHCVHIFYMFCVYNTDRNVQTSQSPEMSGKEYLWAFFFLPSINQRTLSGTITAGSPPCTHQHGGAISTGMYWVVVLAPYPRAGLQVSVGWCITTGSWCWLHILEQVYKSQWVGV